MLSNASRSPRSSSPAGRVETVEEAIGAQALRLLTLNAECRDMVDQLAAPPWPEHHHSP